ncbi:MAG: aminotransferase class I/II-fold pyridoxal phosphate-dependent enzyme [Clostridia bacterium]|nr:MAG: aminotransferase class I/II-fold pyridoxal phosphate-dependent enzyme [Clostridia bacterium]
MAPAQAAPERFVSPLIRELPPSGIRKFFDLVANTRGVISLGVGEPDFVTPWHIREACFYSLEQGYTMYTSNFGLPELRQEVGRYLEAGFGVRYDPLAEIIITVGASEAIDLALRAVLEPGDEVLIPAPCYVSYQPCALLAGGRPVTVPTRAENDFKLRPAELEARITPRSKVLLLSYPNNPTGAIMTREDLLPIARLAERYDLLVISDEIYAELTYDGRHTSFASLPGMQERTVLINGFSKAFAMTGWRVGYAAAPAPIINHMLKIHQYTMLCAPIMSQKAAIEALRHGREEVAQMVREYDRRRRFVVQRLREIGLDCFEPKGAFYVFPSIAATGMGAEEFSQALLEEEKVAVVPGTAFGEGGEQRLRCSYAASINDLAEAMNRIERFVKRHGS